MNLSEMKQFFETHSPECLKQFKKDRILPREERFGVDGESLESHIRLSCECGCKKGKVEGFLFEVPDLDDTVLFISPLVFVCSDCSKESLIFDSDLHGYDPLIGEESSSYRAEGDKLHFRCPACNQAEFVVTAIYEYSDDLFDEEYGPNEWKGREADAFSWFILDGKCTKCAKETQIADVECA